MAFTTVQRTTHTLHVCLHVRSSNPMLICINESRYFSVVKRHERVKRIFQMESLLMCLRALCVCALHYLFGWEKSIHVQYKWPHLWVILSWFGMFNARKRIDFGRLWFYFPLFVKTTQYTKIPFKNFKLYLKIVVYEIFLFSFCWLSAHRRREVEDENVLGI